MNRKWKIRGSRQFDSAPFLLFGIVNVTPDSFYDGGAHYGETGGEPTGHALKLYEEGAAVLDVGGESTRPGAPPVSADEECARVLPVIRALSRIFAKKEQPGSEKNTAGSFLEDANREAGLQESSGACTVRAAISVDTYKAETAVRAMECGADIVNDISGCAFDPALVDVLVQYQPGYVLTHSNGTPATMQNAPHYDDVTTAVSVFFEERMNMLVRSGLKEDRIMLDPGIGFGKNLDHNLTLLGGLPRFSAFGRPILMGLSNKSMFGHLLGLGVQERGTATAVATALAFNGGAWAHRVHDVRAAHNALSLAQAIRAHTS